MNYEDFIHSAGSESGPPSDLSLPLAAMWWEKKGDWHKAHEAAQEAGSVEGDWVHAYLHRVEGDDSNAGYWYTRAKKDKHKGTFTEEWEAITRALLGD